MSVERDVDVWYRWTTGLANNSAVHNSEEPDRSPPPHPTPSLSLTRVQSRCDLRRVLMGASEEGVDGGNSSSSEAADPDEEDSRSP